MTGKIRDDFYARFKALLTYTELLVKSSNLIAEVIIRNGFFFARWLLKTGAIVLYFLNVTALSLLYILPSLDGSTPGFFISESPPFWDVMIKPTLAILVGAGIGGTLLRILSLIYGLLKNYPVIATNRWGKTTLWLAYVVGGVLGISMMVYALDPSQSLIVLLKSASILVLVILAWGFFFSSLVLFAFPNLGRTIPYSLGYLHVNDEGDELIVSDVADYLGQHFQPNEISGCEALLRLRMDARERWVGGKEIAVAFLGLFVAMIAVIPTLDVKLISGEEDITTPFIMSIIGIFIVVWIWNMIGLSGIKGEKYSTISLCLEACLISLARLENKVEATNEENKSERAQLVRNEQLNAELHLSDLADKSGIGEPFRSVWHAALAHKLVAIPEKAWVMFAPSTKLSHVLLVVWARSQNGRLRLHLSVESFAKVYRVPHDQVESILGPAGWRELTEKNVIEFLTRFDEFFEMAGYRVGEGEGGGMKEEL